MVDNKYSVPYLLRLGMPLVAASIVAYGLHTTDAVMAGWYGVDTLAGLTLAAMVWFLVFLLGTGLGTALTPLLAEAHAQGDQIRIRRLIRMAIWLSVVYSLAMIALLWPSKAQMLFFGQELGVSQSVQDYMRIALWGLGFALAGHALRMFLGVFELTVVQFWISLAALFANGLLNYALIFGNFGMPEMGIRGAALASVLVEILQFLGLAIYAMRKFPQYAIFARLWRPDFDVAWLILRLGLPIGFTLLAEVGMFSASSILMGWLGTLPLAAHGIALEISSMCFMFHVGMSQATSIAASHAAGAQDKAAFKRVTKSAFIIAFTFATIVMISFFFGGGHLVGLFLSPNDPAFGQIQLIGVSILLVAAFFQYFDATQITAMALLRAQQDTNLPLIIASISYWLFGVPASYLLGIWAEMGGRGVWWGLTFGLALAGGLMWLRLYQRYLRD